jgi:hypothetical protein
VLLRRSAHQERATQVYGHDQVPVIVGHLEQQVVAGDPRIVHEHRRRAHVRGDAVDGRLHGHGVADIGSESQRPPSRTRDALDRILTGGLLQVDHGNGEAVHREPRGHGCSDTTRRARDNRNLLGHV